MKLKTALPFIFLLILLGAAFVPSLQTYRQSSASAPSWSALRGVDYQPLCGCPSAPIQPPLSTLSMVHSSGWNLIKTYLSWQSLESNSNYISSLKAEASAAQANGLYVIYNLGDGNQGPPCTNTVWPCGILNAYGGSETAQFWNDLWANNIQYEGTNIWNAEWKNFWLPVIQAIGSNPSTLGYEIMNEPRNNGLAPVSEIQSYNQFIASRMRSVISPSQYIVFMGVCSNPSSCGYGGSGSLQVEQQAPTEISNMAIDFHNYADPSNLDAFPYYFQASQELNMPVLIGEWAPCSPSGTCSTITQSQAVSNISLFEGLFKEYGFANTYFGWQVANQVSPTGGNLLKLLNQNQQQYWVDTAIEKYQGPSITVTFTTTSTTTQNQSSQTSSSSNSSFPGAGFSLTGIEAFATALAVNYTAELELIVVLALAAAIVGVLRRD